MMAMSRMGLGVRGAELGLCSGDRSGRRRGRRRDSSLLIGRTRLATALVRVHSERGDVRVDFGDQIVAPSRAASLRSRDPSRNRDVRRLLKQFHQVLAVHGAVIVHRECSAIGLKELDEFDLTRRVGGEKGKRVVVRSH